MKKINNYSIKLAAFMIKVLFLPLYLIGILIPKNNKVWIFGSWRGEKYSDNPRALFEYVNKERKMIRAIWLTKSNAVLNFLKKNKYEVYKINSIKGIYYAFISGVVVLCVAVNDLGVYSFLFPWRKKIIQLWHGTPLKRLDRRGPGFSFKIDILTPLITKYLGRPFDIIISACDLNKKIYSKVYNISVGMVKITGQPRNDVLFETKENKNDKKLFLYLPTWRGYDENPDYFQKYKFNLEKFDNFLERNNANLIIKLHARNEKQYKKISSLFSAAKNIFLSQIEDIYELLSKTDILITDYSSVYFDFLLLNRPIIFTPFDFELYKKLQGFYYDYNSVTPGPKARNWDEVINHMQDILDGIDNFKGKRSMINKDFNKYQDGNSSERVCKEILKII